MWTCRSVELLPLLPGYGDARTREVYSAQGTDHDLAKGDGVVRILVDGNHCLHIVGF